MKLLKYVILIITVIGLTGCAGVVYPYDYGYIAPVYRNYGYSSYGYQVPIYQGGYRQQFGGEWGHHGRWGHH